MMAEHDNPDGYYYGVKLVRGAPLRLQRHEAACDTLAELKAILPRFPGPRAADLFCGAGGMSLGLQEAGFDVLVGVDSDPFALETYAHLFPGLTLERDLSREEAIAEVVEVLRELDITLIAGGPPCQPFSRAGRPRIRDLIRSGLREAHDERRDLWESFIEIVLRVEPRAVVLENVPDMALNDRMMILREMVDELEATGYRVWTRILDTEAHGIPQFRTRLIVVGVRDGSFDWPAPVRRRASLGLAIRDLPDVEPGWPQSVEDHWMPYAEPENPNDFVLRARKGLEGEDRRRIYDHYTRVVRDDDRETFLIMDSDMKYSDVDERLRRYRSDIFDDKYKKLDWAKPSRTITAHIAKDGYWYIHPEQPRTLTVREAARLQTFPDRVRFAGPPTAAFRQIGNAVPPLLAEQVGRAVFAALNMKPDRAYAATRDIAKDLEDWVLECGLDTPGASMLVPWLKGTTAWMVLQGEMLLSRTSPAPARQAWRTLLHSLAKPTDSLQKERRLRAFAESGYFTMRNLGRVLEAAKWFEEKPELLVPLADSLAANPHVPESSALMAELVLGGEARPAPIIASAPVLRVAARHRRKHVNKTNRLTDGRVEIARMVGMDDALVGDDRESARRNRSPQRARRAQLALIELAEVLCISDGEPYCEKCPIAVSCGYWTDRQAAGGSGRLPLH